MQILINKLALVILVCTLLSCSDKNTGGDMNDSKFEPISGWVLVSNGSLDEIKAAIVDYESLAKAEKPGTFKVELHRQKNGDVAVMFPEGLPSYDIADITGWLNAPPDQKNVYGAKSWVVSSNTAVKYFLRPETENEWGDTLIGSSKEGKAIRVYVPETGIAEISQSVEYEIEPSVALNSNPVIFTITLDTEISWANPTFSINKDFDFDWKY